MLQLMNFFFVQYASLPFLYLCGLLLDLLQMQLPLQQQAARNLRSQKTSQ